MSDDICREDAMEAVNYNCTSLKDIKRAIFNLPSADVVERKTYEAKWNALATECMERERVVKCKDCWKRPFDNCPFYEHLGYQPEDDFFCGEGERKDNE